LNDPFIEFLQGLRLNEIRPADQGHVIWHLVEIYPAERSQTQAVSHIPLEEAYVELYLDNGDGVFDYETDT
jgi:hypothetical protein